MLDKSPMTTVSAPGMLERAVAALCSLRAWSTTLWPAATICPAAIFPSPSAEPVTKIRAILKVYPVCASDLIFATRCLHSCRQSTLQISSGLCKAGWKPPSSNRHERRLHEPVEQCPHQDRYDQDDTGYHEGCHGVRLQQSLQDHHDCLVRNVDRIRPECDVIRPWNPDPVQPGIRTQSSGDQHGESYSDQGVPHRCHKKRV